MANDLANAMRKEFNKDDPTKTKHDKSKKVLKKILSKNLGFGDKGAEFLVEKTKFYKNIIIKMKVLFVDLNEYPI
jgi:hypothetical protein